MNICLHNRILWAGKSLSIKYKINHEQNLINIYLHNRILWTGKSQANVLEYLYPVATQGIVLRTKTKNTYDLLCIIII